MLTENTEGRGINDFNGYCKIITNMWLLLSAEAACVWMEYLGDDGCQSEYCS